MNPADIAKDAIRIATTAGLSKDVIDLLEKKVSLLAGQITTLNDKLALSETENANLKKKVTDLEQETIRLRPKDALPDDAIKILEVLFDRGSLAMEYVAETLGIQKGMAEHYKDTLVDAEMVVPTGIGFSGFGASGDWVETSGSFGLTAKGRAFVAKRRAK